MFSGKQSIRRRIMIWSGLLIIAMSTILVVYTFYIAENLAMENGADRAKAQAVEEKLIIEQKFIQAYDIARTISSTVMTIRNDDSIVEKRNAVEEIVEKILIDNPQLIGVNLGFESNAFDSQDYKYINNSKYGKNGQFIPYISYENNILNIKPIENMETSEFYISPKNQKKPTITEPYEYVVQGQMVLMTTIVFPIYEDDTFIGIVGVDIPVGNIQDITIDVVSTHDINSTISIVSNKGMIVANSMNERLITKNISILYDDYEKDIKRVNEKGLVSKYAETKYKIISPIKIGDIDTKWYIFNEIEIYSLFIQTLRDILKIAAVVIIMMVLGFIITWIIIGKATVPIISFVEEMKGFDIDDIESSLKTKTSTLLEVDILVKAYNNILGKLKENFRLRDRKNWLQQGQMRISSLIQKNNELQKLSTEIISFVTKQVNGQVGVLYLLNTETREKQYDLIANYAYKRRKGLSNSFKIGEGLIGQIALERELIVISDVPEDYITIHSGVGNTIPKNIIIIPCEFNDEIIAVLEIGLVSNVSDDVIEYLELIQTSIAIALSNILNFNNVKKLLDRTKEQAEELQIQQEELKTTNEELEEQTVMLKNSQAELESQQEELRVINEELEENSQQLGIQKNQLENKNIQLEKARSEIEKKAMDLESSSKYKSEFLANMSHELRTPLNSILILSELLSENRGENLSEKDIEFASTINTSGKDLLKLINDILDLSKVEAGKTKVNIEEMDLHKFETELTGLFNQVAIKKDLEFSVRISKKLPTHIMTDEQKVKQIIINLLSNAFKFTKDGSVKLNLDLLDEKIIFEVIDTGIGIVEDKINSIFEAFQQEDGTISRQFGGTGLGLSISMEYAKLLGGKLEVESKQNVGSTFTFSMPIIYNMKDSKSYEKNLVYEISHKTIKEINREKSEEKISYISDDRDNIQVGDNVILIIDDDANFAGIMMDIVREKGFKAIVSETGESGLFLADSHLPTAIILDIGLPGIDGWEVMDRLKKNKRTKNIPVYFISSMDKEEGISLKGALKYIKKPITTKQIDEILEETKILKSQKFESILVIEDNEIQRNNIIEFIKKNYEELKVASCICGKDALEKLDQTHYDLIILDLNLEDYSRFEFVEKLKSNAKYKDIPIIIYTGQDISISEEKKLREKVNDIIIKGDKSTSRLLDEIKLFVHNVNKVSNKVVVNIMDNKEVYNDKTVLVVDDDMRNIFALSSILESNGMKLEIANDGREAIDKLKENNKIDLVLMDIMMPEMNGYEAMEKIRKMHKFKKLPIIALTAKAMKGDRDKCIQSGANEYLSKPIDKNKLLSILRVWLSN